LQRWTKKFDAVWAAEFAIAALTAFGQRLLLSHEKMRSRGMRVTHIFAKSFWRNNDGD
jgi:hypothetical protein